MFYIKWKYTMKIGGGKMKKKLISTLCASAMLLTGGLTLTACKDTSEQKVMNVSLNPEVEFVLDKDNKVLSVNALNSEGNIILSTDAEFVGKDANEAVKLFVSISKENGYLVSGSYTSEKNNIEVSISGSAKEIDKLYKNIESSVKSKLEELDIEGTISKAENLTKEYLEKMVAECSPYLEKAKIEAMKYEDLIKEIKNSRNETKELYSQELKEMYYQAKADALRLAQLEKVKEQVNVVTKGILSGLETTYKSAIDTIETTRREVFLKEDSVYQLAVKNFNEAKANYLKKRKEISEMESNKITDEIKASLTSLDALVASAETNLNNAYTSAMNALDTAKTTITTAYNAIVEAVNNAGSSMDIISNNLTEAIIDFTTKFETDYATYKTNAKNRINDFKNRISNTNN